jgi:hypothetical protein
VASTTLNTVDLSVGSSSDFFNLSSRNINTSTTTGWTTSGNSLLDFDVIGTHLLDTLILSQVPILDLTHPLANSWFVLDLFGNNPSIASPGGSLSANSDLQIFLTVTLLVFVPEPSSFAMCCIVSMALLGWRMKRWCGCMRPEHSEK